MDGRRLYQCADAALVRAVAHRELGLPAWPDLTGSTSMQASWWCAWLRKVWAVDAVAEAVEHASPVLAAEVDAVCAGHAPDPRRTLRMVQSVARYVLRMTGRATPFGLFAGVAPARFGLEPVVRCGHDHRAIARPDAAWLAGVITRLESCSTLLDRLSVVANNLCFVRGGRLVVPHRPAPDGELRAAAVDVSIRHTAAVRMSLEAARSPIGCAELAEKVVGEFPTASPAVVGELLGELVRQGVLITSLHAPSTVTDAFAHLLEQLDAVGADDIPQVTHLLSSMRVIKAELAQHNRTTSAGAGRRIRKTVAEQMSGLEATCRQPVAVDLRLDCSLTLPRQVAREAEAVTSALVRLSPHPFGTTAWQRFHKRFFERYGIGALVPVLDVVDPDVGLGLPTGYAGSTSQEPRASVSDRDERLLALAQAAALDRRDEVVLDERLVTELAPEDVDRAQVPPHLEMCFQLQARSRAELGRGEFELTVISVSRGAGTTTGRFVSLLEPADQQRMAATFARLPTSDPDTLPVQLSFLPLVPGTAHVTRAPELLPAVISLAEHREPDDTVIPLDDLAVGCDGHRLYLASLTLGQRLEPTMLHALELRAHTPPLARFLAELGRAQATVVTGFDWGTAHHLPYLPRVRYGRTVLSPARWLLTTADLPERGTSWPEWLEAVDAWRARRRLPDRVYLAKGDRRLPLDLDHEGHLALLRTHLEHTRHGVLTEAPTAEAHGWFDGRAHEIVVPLTAARPARWPTPPQITRERAIRRDHGHLPGTSRWLYAKLYGHPDRQAEILGEYLPELLAQWEEPPAWWFIRYRDPDWHLRLRIALPTAEDFGLAAQRVSFWAGRLRRLRLLSDVQFATYYPETGRWGGGAAMDAAEEVFGADSRALLTQFTQRPRPHPQVLAAASFAAIAAGFIGSTEAGMTWLIEHAKTESSPGTPRQTLNDAVRLADPTDDWAALRSVQGGQAISTAWEALRRALADYRARLATVEGIDPDAVLVSLLHAHHIRAVGIDIDDERTCLRLARAAALAWRARISGSRG